MRRIKWYAMLICICTILSLQECTTDRNSVSVAHTNFTGEVEQDQNLVFTFNKKLVSDSLLNNWDTTRYITFSPAIKGRFKWGNVDELVFSPEEPFLPSTDYKAVINGEIVKHSKQKYAIKDDKPILFHTPYLNMVGTQLFYALSQQNTNLVQVRINLSFNCKVRPTVLQKLLHITINGMAIPFDIIGTEPDNMIGLSIPDQPRTAPDERIPVIIHIDKGLPCSGSSYVSKAPLETSAELPIKEKLLVAQITAAFANGEGMVNILTNQPIVNENLEKNVKVDPAVKFKIETAESGLRLTGDFEPGKTYTLTLSKALRGIFGTYMNTDYTDEVVFGELQPMIAFENQKALYLSSAGEKNVAINIAAVQKVKITVSRIYENNITHFLRSGTESGYGREAIENNDEEGDNEDGGGYNYESHSYQYYRLENYGDQVFTKVYDVHSLPKLNNLRLLNLSLDDLDYNSGFKGVYIVKVEDTERRWLQASTIISLSDIGLIAKQGQNKMIVFANSILNATPLGGVKVDFISTNNQKVFTATTDNDGVAIFDNTEEKLGKFRVGMVTCHNGQDFNFMFLNKTQVETSRYNVGGKMSNDAHLDAFMYGDRDLYRPGDSIHMNAIVRTDEWQILKDVPVKFKLLLPNGKEYQNQKKTLDGQGSVCTDFYLPSSIITGTYTIELFTANDVMLSSKTVGVEEFMPDRIKYSVTFPKERYKPAEAAVPDIKVENYFGTAAAELNYELNMTISRRDFYPSKFNDYIFWLKTPSNVTFENISRNGKTDKDGKINESFPMPSYTDYGILQANLAATVFDETGRPVSRSGNFEVVTQDVFYGIKNFEQWVGTNSSLNFKFVAVDINEQPVTAPAMVEIYRYQWETVLERRGDRFVYESHRKEQLLYSNKIDVKTTGASVPFIPTYSGDYEVRIHRQGSETYVAKEFWAYGYGYTQNTSFEVSNEGEVILEADKKEYKVGEQAKVLIKSPFNGRILITVERGNVYDYYFKETDNKSASITLDLKDEYLPNVYITATAIRNITDNSLPLTVARGFIPIKVENPVNKIPVSIACKESVRSKTKQTITVKSAPGAEVTVAVVDEGILAIKNYKTPDPYAWFYMQRALEVNSYDLYPFLFPEIQNHQSSSGGDMGNDMVNKRTNPISTKRVALLAKWSGIITANGNGEATYTIDVPQFSGSVRVMAVAYKGRTFGSAEKNMIIADPVVISTALPRFTAPGDSLVVPVTLSNTTGQPANLTATISASSPLFVSGKATQSVQVNAKGEGRVVFKLYTINSVGASSVTVTVSDGKEKFTDVTEIGCRPLSSLQKLDGDGMIKGGESKTVSITAPFIPSSMDAKLIISKSPMAQFTKDLRYLIEYPYGCVEQTTSAAFPQLYLNDLTATIGTKGPKRYNPDYNVREAIKKLESMQLYNGALSYWPGGDYESWWGTVYATHFLLEADKAGFDVNKTILNKALAYLQFKIRSHGTYEYHYWDEKGIARKRDVLEREIPYSLYVLALAGKYDVSTMNFCKSNPQLLTLDSKYMVACAYGLSGNQMNYKAMLPPEFQGEVSQAELAGSFCSPIRDEAIALNCLIETSPDDPQVGIMAAHLATLVKNQHWMNTQESSFALLALGKLARKAAKATVTAQVLVDGSSVGQFNGKDLTISKGVAGKSVTIQTSGSGNLYYSWELEGISNSGAYVEEDKNLKARRTYYDKYGHVITSNNYKQNDLVVVKISLQTTIVNENVENVAITDLLPAGFEIENPRISSVPELEWIKDAANPNYMDIRDDRINIFTTATPQVKYYYYIVRAVSKGRFKQGPVHADAMYSMDYHSYNGAGVVIIK